MAAPECVLALGSVRHVREKDRHEPEKGTIRLKGEAVQTAQVAGPM